MTREEIEQRMKCTEAMLMDFDRFFDIGMSREFIECIRIALRRSWAIDKLQLAEAEKDGAQNEIQD